MFYSTGTFVRALYCPVRAQHLGLHQHRLHRLLLQVGRITVFVQDALHHHANLSTGAFAQRPVNRHTLANLGDQLSGDYFEFVVAHRLDGRFVRS